MENKIYQNLVKKNILTHLSILQTEQNNIVKISNMFAKTLIDKIKKGGKILIAGNGGSAADAQHFATELTVRLKKNRKSIPALALTTDTSALTAIGNDFSFDKIFSRQLEGIANKKDIFIGISTSGNSKNIIEAFKFCKKNKIYSLGILGNSGGKSKKYLNSHYSVNFNDASRVQEIHIIFWQNICEIIEDYFSKKKLSCKLEN